MSRKIAWVVLLVACLIISVCGMAGAKVEGTKHDFSLNNGATNFGGTNLELENAYPVEEICVFCHTPHSAAPTAATGVQGLLWNRSGSSAATYKMYTSSTLTDAVRTNMGAAPTGLTLMCMSCHDGITSIAVGTLINAPYSQGDRQQVTLTGPYSAIGELYRNVLPIPGWRANIGNMVVGDTEANLSDDHPVSFEWVPGITGIKDPAAWGAAPLKLFSNRMECSTCHDVHDNTHEPFLRMSNVNSDMCTTCHIK